MKKLALTGSPVTRPPVAHRAGRRRHRPAVPAAGQGRRPDAHHRALQRRDGQARRHVGGGTLRARLPEHRRRGSLVDSRTWAWQLSRPLQPGERCIFSAKSGYTSPTGETFSGKNRFELQGAAPRPWRIVPAAGQPIEEDQAFVINGGSTLDAKSLEQNLWCEADGVGQRLPARPVPDTVQAKCSTRSAAWATRRSLSPAASAGRQPRPTGVGQRHQSGERHLHREGRKLVHTVREPFKASLLRTRKGRCPRARRYPG